MNNIFEKIILSKAKLKKIIKKLADKINSDYKNKDFIMVGILKGCNPFMQDLAKKIKLVFPIYYMEVSSYNGNTFRDGDKLNVSLDLTIDVKDKNILIVEDIVDTGYTLNFIKNHLKAKGAYVKILTLLNKEIGRKVDIKADYIGYEISDQFVVGYGFDYKEKYRNLEMIYELKKSFVKEDLDE